MALELEKMNYYGFLVCPDIVKTEQELLLAMDKFKQGLDLVK